MRKEHDCKDKRYGLHNRHSGNVSLIVAAGLVIILGVSALVTDYGLALVQQTRLQYAMDAAVLAGVSQLVISESAALAKANEYLLLNGVQTTEVVLTADANAGRVSAIGAHTLNTWFGQLLGVQTITVNATSGAVMGVAGSITGGLRPYAVTDRYYEYGDLIVLKQESGYHGNFGAVALGGTGANVLKENALYGYSGTLKIGDYIPTETGNMIGVVNQIKDRIAEDPSTFTNYTPESYRLWTIPVVDSLNVDGRKDVLIVGFAQVFIEEVRNRAGKMEIVGRFTRFVGTGEIQSGATDYGVYVVKLDQ